MQLKSRLNTISSKLLVRFVVIILVTLFILGIALAYLFQDYYYDNKEQKFIQQGKKIANLVQSSLYKGNYQQTVSFLKDSRRFFEGEVWVVNSKGLVLATTQGQKFQSLRLNNEEIKHVFRGKIISKRSFSRYFEEPMLFTAVPIIFQNKVIGAVFVYSPLAGLLATLSDLAWLLLYAALIAIILAFIISYTLSKRFSRPLKRMKEIAVSMAHGNFSERVEINTDDEIGQLASSFNYLADKLEDTIASLQEKEQLQRRFVADVSHELRTPLTSIQGFVKALRDGVYESKEDQQEYYLIIFNEVKRLIRLVNDLLDLSRIELGQIKMEQKPLDLESIISGVVKNFEPNLKEKELNIDLELDQPPLVMADQDRIEQVLVNLIGNAVSFTPSGGEIRIYSQEDEDQVQVFIEDNGPGIPEAESDEIWNRFHKVDKARTTTSGGTGLGLSIVKEIIDKHNGQIWVESKEGVGSTFVFTLSRVKK
ncbi:HAMP domain-containing sensor histidine kinase [Halanaerocella petrolearia]